MPHDGKVHRDDGHGEHGYNKDLSREHMSPGTFAERHGSGPGHHPQGPTANMDNQYGRIGHRPFLEIHTWTGAPVFHPTGISPERQSRFRERWLRSPPARVDRSACSFYPTCKDGRLIGRHLLETNTHKLVLQVVNHGSVRY